MVSGASCGTTESGAIILAGTLEIQLAANMARLADDMHKAQRTVYGAMANIEKSVSSAKSVLASLGVGLSVVGFVRLIQGSIDAADRLSDLQKSTNLTAKELAGLNLLAKQSGTDLDGLAKAINKMSVEMGNDPAKFRALGITAKNNKDALMQFADIFATLPDINQRNALTMAVFGKSWEQLAPVLAQGGQRIGEIIDKGALYSGTTQEMTDQADLFNDQMAELNITMGATRKKMVGDMLPAMNEIADAMREASKESNGLYTIWIGMGGAMSWLFGLTESQKVSQRLREINEQLAVATKQLAAGSLKPSGAGSHLFSFLVPDVKLGEQALNNIRATIAALEKEKALLRPAAPASPAATDKAAAAAAAARAKAFLDKEEAAKKLREEQEKLVKAEQNYMESVGNTTQALMDKAVAAEQENELIGKTAAQIALIEAARYDEQISAKVAQAAILDGIDGREDELFMIREQIKALLTLKDARENKGMLEANADAQKKLDEQNKRTAEALEGHITEALMRGFENGKSFGENFKDTLENMFKSMVLEPQIKATVTMALDALGFGTASAALNTSATSLNGSASALTSAAAALKGSATKNADMPAGGANSSAAAYLLAAYVGYTLVKALSRNETTALGGQTYEGTASNAGFTGSLRQSYRDDNGPLNGGISYFSRYSALSSAQSKAANDYITSLQKTFGDLGDAIGDMSIRTKSWSVNISGATDLTKILADAMGTSLVPALEKFRLEGENLADTAKRLTGIFAGTNSLVSALGMSAEQAFGAIGIAGAGARERLISIAGGMDSFNDKISFFISNFLTEAQQVAPALDIVARTFTSLGISGVETNEQFAELVKHQLALGNYETVDRLLGVAGAFNAITSAAKVTSNQLLAMVKQSSFRTMVDYKRAQAHALSGVDNGIGKAMKNVKPVLDKEKEANESAARAALKARVLGILKMDPYWWRGIPEIGIPLWRHGEDTAAWMANVQKIYDALPSYAAGNPYVAQDMTANIHRGEMVVDAQSASMMRRYGLSSGNDALVAEVRALKTEVESLRRSAEDTARSTRKTSDLLVRVTRDGESVVTTPA